LPFDRKVEALVLDRSDVALIVRPMLMSVPGIGVLSALAYVSTVEDPARFIPASRQAEGRRS
jgi:hypothetical protein